MDERVKTRIKIELPYLIRVIASDVMEKAVALMESYGVKRREVRYIISLYHGPKTQKELCDILKLDKANTARAISTLKGAALVESVRAPDGRSQLITLSRKGRELAEIIDNFLDTNMEIVCSNLGDTEIDALMDTFESFCTNIDTDGSIINNIEILKERIDEKLADRPPMYD